MERSYTAAALALPVLSAGLTAKTVEEAALTAAVAVVFGVLAWCAIFWNRDDADETPEPIARSHEHGLYENHVSLHQWRERAAASAERSRCRRNGGDF